MAHRRKHMRKTGKNPRGTRTVSIWIWILGSIGVLAIIGILLLYRDSARLESMILSAMPVDRLTAETTGIVRLQGEAKSDTEFTDEGILKQHYALLQKETFRWRCSKNKCDYERDEDSSPEVWGDLTVNEVPIRNDHYRFYTSWVPLDSATVMPDYMNRFYEAGTSRPLLVEKPKGTAYGYHAVRKGSTVTVIGEARNGRLEPFALPGKYVDKPTLLIGASVEQMVAGEKKYQSGYLMVAGIISLLLLPIVVMIFRRFFRNRDRSDKKRAI